MEYDFYNIVHYASPINVEVRRAFRGTQLRVGHRAPDFQLITVQPDGEFRLAEETTRGPVAVIFGCLSAPPCVRELPAIDALGKSLDPPAQIVFVYTREIHPGDLLPRHETMSQKSSAARQLKSQLNLSLTVAVDDLDGATHRAYGGLPFMAVVVDRSGLVVHRSEWASAAQLGMVMDNLAERDGASDGHLPHLVSYSETLWFIDGGTPREHDAVLRGAGEGALSDAAGGPPNQELWAAR